MALGLAEIWFGFFEFRFGMDLVWIRLNSGRIYVGDQGFLCLGWVWVEVGLITVSSGCLRVGFS